MARAKSRPTSSPLPPSRGAGFVDTITLKREEIPEAERELYPFDIPSIGGLDQLKLHPAITFLVGENGSGKSTLLEAIAVKLGFSAEGGSRNFQFSTRDSHSCLHHYLRISRRPLRESDHFFLRAESFYTLMTQVEEYGSSWGDGSPHEQSHGEAFLCLLTEKLRGNGLYLFDEPEAALSAKRQMAALVRIHDLVGRNSQFIIATHSPILLAYPNASIYECSETGLRPVTYQETEPFRTMRDFMQSPERWMELLLGEQNAA